MFNFFFFCAFVFLAPFLTSSEITQQKYFDLIEQYPKLIYPKGDASKGEIEIILDKEKIAAIEKETGRDVGVLQQDHYWLWVNDACLFPSGVEGVYGRFLWIGSLKGSPAVAVLPVLPDERIALLCNYRHATRSWALELPQGIVDKGETAELAALREAKEEAGFTLGQLQLLGNMTFDTGASTTVLPVFAGRVLAQNPSEREDSEAIETVVFLSLQEIKKAFKRGFHVVSIRGEEKKVPFRDSILAYAITIYEESLRGSL